jgi:hypothetical protein
VHQSRNKQCRDVAGIVAGTEWEGLGTDELSRVLCLYFQSLPTASNHLQGWLMRTAKPPFVGSNPTRASKILRHLVGFGLPLDCTLIAQCFQEFHCLERAFWHVFDLVAFGGADAGAT